MAITIDQVNLGNTGNDATATTVAFTTTQTVASNAFIVVPISWGDQTVTLSSVAGGGLSWAVDKQDTGASGGVGNQGCAVASAQAPSGLASGTTITATFSATTVGRGICGLSFTGVLSAAALDTTSGATNFSATTAWTTASTTVVAGSVLIAVAHGSNTNDTSTVTSPATFAQTFTGGAGTFGMVVGYQIVAGGGATTIAGVWSGSETGTVVAAAYKVGAGGGGGGGTNAPEKLRVVQSSQRW